MTALEIGTGDQRFRLEPEDHHGQVVQYVLAELRYGGLTATRRVYHGYASDFQDLASFFADLAVDRRGWDGIRNWESVEGDLHIEARHRHGHVHLRVTVRDPGPGWGDEGWLATAHLKLDPGEELSQIAAQAADFAGLSDPN